MRYNVGLGSFMAIFVVALAVIAAVPLITIWSFNTLFAMGIEYTAWTWLAMFWLQAVLTGSVGAAIRRNRD
jgi:ABC-type Co2+ transport system permease subunit